VELGNLQSSAPPSPAELSIGEPEKETNSLAKRFNIRKKIIKLDALERNIISELMTMTDPEMEKFQNAINKIIEEQIAAIADVGRIADITKIDRNRLKKITLGMAHVLLKTEKKQRAEVLNRKINEIKYADGNSEFILMHDSPESFAEGGIGIVSAGHFGLTEDGAMPVMEKRIKNKFLATKATQEGFINLIIIDNQRVADYPNSLPKKYYSDENITYEENIRINTDTDRDLETAEKTPQEFAIAIADAIQACRWLHKIGIIHKDIKPSNIILTKDGRAVLVDVGLSECHRDDKKYGENVISEMTTGNNISGTLGYFDVNMNYIFGENGEFIRDKNASEKIESVLRPETDQFAFAVTILEKVFKFSLTKYLTDNDIGLFGLILGFEKYRSRLNKEINTKVKDEKLREVLLISVMDLNNQRTIAETEYLGKYGAKPNLEELENALRNLII
jgi:serine/threonine protein kinase